MLKPGGSRTFQEYSTVVFISNIESQLEYRSRLDLVWDCYLKSGSLKATVRCNRGKGIRRRVTASGPLPSNWQNFLRNSDNKEKLFSFLSEQVMQLVVKESHSKKTAWATWNAFPEVTTAFLSLASTPSELPDGVLSTQERFIVLLYDSTSTCCDVNVLRKKLFSRKSRSLEDLPPTRAALEQHIKRAAYQAGHIWGQATIAFVSLPSPCDWGWMKSGDELEPLWTTLSEVSVMPRAHLLRLQKTLRWQV
ncbi:putative nuclease HARBI1-like 24 [Homarus americanus]|uniref:Putative nuclease HARBI1-like 24 n=1 Tax=Homarus americanus TaxID=6706 RepID=A0A8J5K681_HOMAM|nr:putative nuclease HARBI1-like 24 [Homarus americanus]